jgi:TRAP-type C4-dicarboxylate transport system permease small subunit
VLRVNRYVAVAVFAVLTSVVGLQVVDRLVLHRSFIWSEEIARFLFFWVVMLGAAMSVHFRRHFTIDLFDRRHRTSIGASAFALDLVPHVLVCAFSLFLVWLSLEYVEAGLFRHSTNASINMGAVYAAIPVFAALSAFYSARHIVTDYRAYRHHRSRRVTASVPPAE